MKYFIYSLLGICGAALHRSLIRLRSGSQGKRAAAERSEGGACGYPRNAPRRVKVNVRRGMRTRRPRDRGRARRRPATARRGAGWSAGSWWAGSRRPRSWRTWFRRAGESRWPRCRNAAVATGAAAVRVDSVPALARAAVAFLADRVAHFQAAWPPPADQASSFRTTPRWPG